MSFNLGNDFAVGGDISWLPQIEALGFPYKNSSGELQDCLNTLKEFGMNSVRLRTWVHSNDFAPTDSVVRYLNGYCSTRDTLKLAKRCQDMGFKVMINFHYSDAWCNPRIQRKPALWERLSFDELVQALYDYTRNFFIVMKEGGVDVSWVQIGNETDPGMLLPEGSTDNFSRLTALYNAGYDAVKSVSPKTSVLIHLASGTNSNFVSNYFDNLRVNGCRYDMIGLSYYPYWGKVKNEDAIGKLEQTLHMLPQRFGKPTMVVEIGSEVSKEQEMYDYIMSVLDVISRVPNQTCRGLMYWEPEGAMCVTRYNLCAWRNDGCPSQALRAFLEAK